MTEFSRSLRFTRTGLAALVAFALLLPGGAALAAHHEKAEKHEKCEKCVGKGGAHGHGFLRARARIGVKLQPMTEELRAYFKAPKTRGVLVAGVTDDSPAKKAGVRAGDVIVRAGGENIAKPRDLMHAVRENEDGEKLNITLLRDGRERKVSVTPVHVEGKMGRGMKRAREMVKGLEARLRAVEEKLGLPSPAPAKE